MDYMGGTGARMGLVPVTAVLTKWSFGSFLMVVPSQRTGPGEGGGTGSVAVGTTRDGRDTTGRNSIVEAYLARRGDFTKEFANSTK